MTKTLHNLKIRTAFEEKLERKCETVLFANNLHVCLQTLQIGAWCTQRFR